MARNQVKLSYQRVQRRKPAKATQKPQEAVQLQFRPRSPLAIYLAQEAESGLSIPELVEQFQEYDCVHDWGEEPIAVTLHEDVFMCVECGLTKHKKRPGISK